MEQLLSSKLAAPGVATTSTFNCSGQWTSSNGEGVRGGTTTACLICTHFTPKFLTPTLTRSSTSVVYVGQTIAHVTLSTFSTSGASLVSTEITLPINISSQTTSPTIAISTTSDYNPSKWSSATMLNSLRLLHSTISPSLIHPEITSSSLSPIHTSYTVTQYLNSTVDSHISSSSSPLYSTFIPSSPPSPTSSLFSSPSTPTHIPTPTTVIGFANQNPTDTTIGITAGILLAVVGLASFFCMALLLYVRWKTMAMLQKNNGREEEDVGDEGVEGREGGRDEEGGCRCGWMRYEMEGVGRPPEMEPGLDHGALIRYEMSAG